MKKGARFDPGVQLRLACRGNHRRERQDRALLSAPEGAFNPARFRVDRCRGPLVIEGPRFKRQILRK